MPLSSISDIVVNEGIWRWQIIYYLVIVQNEKANGPTKLEIGFRVSLRMFERLVACLVTDSPSGHVHLTGITAEIGASTKSLGWD